MKTVRVVNGIVREIVPDDARPVEQWYGAEFAAQCHEATDEVGQGWIYDMETGTFAPPAEPASKPGKQIATLKAELSATDYKAIKYAEGWLSAEEYAPIRAERQAIRDEINRLEGGGNEATGRLE